MIYINFYDEETGYAQPIYWGEEGRVKAYMEAKDILGSKEVDKLLKDGYYVSSYGEFYQEETYGK